MIRIITFLLFAFIALAGYSQKNRIDYDYLNKNFDYLNKAGKQANRGGILILTGIGTSVGGGILLFKYGIWTESSPNARPYTHLTLWMPVGIAIMARGLAIFGTGVGNCISWTIKKGKARRNL